MLQQLQIALAAPTEKNPAFRSRCFGSFLLGLAVTCFAISTQGSPIDGTLYTTYNISTDHTQVHWIVCGSTKSGSGCYDGGNLGPFGKVGALLEGSPTTDATTHTVTRAIYIVDVAAGTSGAGVDLDVYTKKDVISATFDTTTVTLSQSISLPLTGGSTALTSMAANRHFVFHWN